MEEQIKLVIDTREHALIKSLEKIDVEFEISQLDVGDIIFCKGNETTHVFERKTISDLKSSICDGRHREQKARLIGTYEKYKIAYIIEGNLNGKYSMKGDKGIPLSTIMGALINTQYRDGIKVYRTGTVEETAEYLSIFLKKCRIGECIPESQDVSDPVVYATKMQRKKKNNVTSELLAIRTISSISGVSEHMASAVLAEHGNLFALLQCYNDLEPDAARKILQDIRYTPSLGQEKRIGPAASKKIYDLLSAM